MRLLFIIMIVLAGNGLWATSEQYVKGITGNEIQAVWDETQAYALVTLQDPIGHAMPGDATSSIRMNLDRSNLSAKLWYEDVEMRYHSMPWSIKVNYYIELIEAGTGESITHYESLLIDYTPDGGYSDIQMRDYPGYTSAFLTLDEVEVITDIPGFQIPNDVRLDLVYEVDRHYEVISAVNGFTVLTPLNSGGLIDYTATTDDGVVDMINGHVRGLPIIWDQVAEARSYDLEWLFIDCLHEQNHIDSDLPSLNPEVDFRNATRVNVSTNYYEIPLGFPEGYLILRVRPIGVDMDDMTTRVEGSWTKTNVDIPTLNDARLSSYGSGAPFVFAFRGVEEGMNWQYTAGFAEEGKRKESLSFFDGGLRSRQSMTFLNTEDKALVGESHYDFQGRPSFQVLPSPIANNGLQFYSNLNGSYDKDDFDVDYYETPALTPLPGEDGAHVYFSPDNTDLDGVHERYVPDADGYPFTRAIYTNDGTNRLAVQSGAGSAHTIVNPLEEDDDHTQKVYYTVPTQTELDRLFGNNAGIAKHYQKVVSKDPNGQHTVAYLDQEGRTVATALLGGNFAETHLIDLDGRPDAADLNADLLVNNTIIQEEGNNYVMASSSFSVPLADSRVFNYSITPDYFMSCAGEPLACEYHLSILVYNEFGELEIDFSTLTTDQGTTPLINAITHENYDAFDVSWTIDFPPGTYQVVKKLTIDEESIQTAYDNIMGSIEAFNPVIVPFADNEAIYSDANFQLNYEIGEEDAQPLTHLAAGNLMNDYAIRIYNTEGTNFCVSFDFEMPICDCESETDIAPEETCIDPKDSIPENGCYSTYWMMIADLSPGGQYFDNHPAQFSNELGVLVENDNYLLEINAWLDAKSEEGYDYMNETVSPENDLCWTDLGISEEQPNAGQTGCPIDVLDIYRKLALVDEEETPFDWDVIRASWYSTWNGQWPALDGLTFDPNHGYLPFDENGEFAPDALEALDNLFHLHPEAMSYENTCDIRAYDEYYFVEGEPKCQSNYSLPDRENIEFMEKMTYVTGADYIHLSEVDSLQTAIDLGLFYAPFDFYTGPNLYYPIEHCEGVSDQVYINLDCDSIGFNLEDYYVQSATAPLLSIADLAEGDLENYICMSFTEYNLVEEMTWTNEIEDPMSCSERKLLIDELMHFMPLANGEFMSIYAVLDDPLGVAIWDPEAEDYTDYPTDAYFDTPQIETIRSIHDMFNRHGLTKWDFFKSNYLFFREKVNRKMAFSVSGRINDNDEIPTTANLVDYEGHTTETSFIQAGDLSGVFSNENEILYGVHGGYTLYFPYTPLFDNNYESETEIINDFAGACTTECEVRIALVLENLQSWIAENGLSPMTNEEYETLVEDLSGVCIPGCENSWSGLSEEEISDLTSYFDAEINYYEYTNGMGELVHFEDVIGTVNPAWEPFVVEPLELAGSQEINYGAQSMGDCSYRLFTTYVYTNYQEIFIGELGAEITEENFTLYNAELETISEYINLTALRNHLNSNSLFTSEETFVEYPADSDLLALIELCNSTDKVYCANSTNQNSCYDALVTGTSTLSPGEPGVVYPLREAFLCVLNNPTMTELNKLECYGLWDLELDNAMTTFQNDLNEIMEGFYEGMLATGLAATETFTMNYLLDEFAYTLYYYDQAGNLVQTVPPAGVDILASDPDNIIGDENFTLEDVIAHRVDNSNPFVLPAHTLKTQYKFNTLDNVRESETPDGGKSRFYYDALGRLILSQNARQEAKVDPTYSYTFYDELGRPYESGEVSGVDYLMSQGIASEMTGAEYSAWVNNGTSVKRDVVMTFYDESISSAEISEAFGGNQSHVRNRVAGVIYFDQINPGDGSEIELCASGNFYSYDAHGNVNRLVQVNNHLKLLNQHIKTIDYSYDLVSGNVNEVVYQQGKWDQFYHRYEYDADNRLMYAFSSQNGRIWEKESRQYYYEHGPLARVEIGDKQVQAEDYAYTIHGWLKGVNSSTKKANRDIGKDGDNSVDNFHAHFGQDAFGYHLSYYQNENYSDYTSIAESAGEDFFLVEQAGMGESQRRDLYNGNISMMVHTMSGNDADVATQTNASRFYYDQLNRLKSSGSFIGSEEAMTASNSLSGALISPFGVTTYEYDFNGNITKLVRTGNDIGNLIMDALKYQYAYEDDKLISNRLRHVNDQLVAADAYSVDLDDQGAYINGDEESYNYAYDETGQLIKDKSENIEEIQWTNSGKVKAILRNTEGLEAGTYPADLAFEYDAFGHRILKIVKPRNEFGILTAPHDWSYTYYVRDAQGNPLTTYETSFEEIDAVEYSHNITLAQSDMHVYGGERLGLKNRNRSISGKVRTGYDDYESEFEDNGTLPTVFIDELNAEEMYDPNQHTRRLGTGNYELTDHRGNVYNVVSDRKLVDSFDGDEVIAYAADVLQGTEYFPFGMPIPGRSFVNEGYRYGFNGKENDEEVSGRGNSVSFEFRDYDPRIGRFKSKDPLAYSYAFQSPYVFAANSPIALIDVLGLGPGGINPQKEENKGRTITNHISAIGGTLSLDDRAHSIEYYNSNCTSDCGVIGGVRSFMLGDMKYNATFNDDGSFNGYRWEVNNDLYTGVNQKGYVSDVFSSLPWYYDQVTFSEDGSNGYLDHKLFFHDMSSLDNVDPVFEYDATATALLKLTIAYGTYSVNKLISKDLVQKIITGVGSGGAFFLTVESGIKGQTVQQSEWFGTYAINMFTGDAYVVPTGSKRTSSKTVVGEREIVYRVLINGSVAGEIPSTFFIDNSIPSGDLPLILHPPTAPNSN